MDLSPVRYDGFFRGWSAAFEFSSPACGLVRGVVDQLANGHVVVSWPGHSEVAVEDGLQVLSGEERRGLFVRCVLGVLDPEMSAAVPDALAWYRGRG